MFNHGEVCWQDDAKAVAVILIIVSIILWSITFTSFEEWLHPVLNGVPTVFIQNNEYWSRINSPVIAENRMYLLFNALSVIKVYDLRGNYLYSVNFSNREQHGTSVIYAKGNEMYFQREHGWLELYYFKDDQFVRKIIGDEAKEKLEILSDSAYHRSVDDKGNCYLLSGTSVVKENVDGEQTTILHRSVLLNLFQNNLIIWIVAAVSALLIIAIKLYIA